jgi:hypothetical protein
MREFREITKGLRKKKEVGGDWVCNIEYNRSQLETD